MRKRKEIYKIYGIPGDSFIIHSDTFATMRTVKINSLGFNGFFRVKNTIQYKREKL